MKKFTHILIVVLIASSFAFAGCARQPSPKSTASIMKTFFKKYGKEYKESVFGKYPVKEVQIMHVEEIHKGLVAVYAILQLDGGMAVQTRFTLLKKPFGWRPDTWENMGVAMIKSTDQD